MPHNAGKAFAFAFILWMIGFVWGSIVFMVPLLKTAPPIPFVSNNPWISFPVLLVWLPMSYFLARSYLRSVPGARAEGLTLGLAFSLMNFGLDLLVLVVLLKAGAGYFLSLTVWGGYALLLFVPWLVGRSLKRAEHT
jgi:hypothetical protein